MPKVRAVSDKEGKYAGFDFAGRRRVVGEVFDWPEDRGMPTAVRDGSGFIVSGWVELVDAPSPPRKSRTMIPGMVDAKAKPPAKSGNDIAPGRRADARVVG